MAAKAGVDYAAKKREVIKLALCGYTVAAISRLIGIAESTVWKYMAAAGFKTNFDADCSLPCPECGGRMQKQDLFFWKCKCGAEWWPSEEMVPENPDIWTPLSRLAVEADMMAMIQRLHEENRTCKEIAEALNNAGYKTQTGVAWTESNVRWIIYENFETDHQEKRERIKEICREMALKAYSSREIADRLNGEGYKTTRGQKWTAHSVKQAIHRLLPGFKLHRGRPGIGRLTLPERMRSKEQPWRQDEAARCIELKARRKYEMSNLQGRDEFGK